MSGTGITVGVRADFEACLALADEGGALELAIGLVTSGVGAEEVLLRLVAPAQVKVGERWQSGEWTVAQEHAATHVSGQVVDAVASAARRTARSPVGSASHGHVLVACSDGEWHVLPSRILAEVLRLRGFRVRSLGGSVSPYELLSDVHRNAPDVIALSCTVPWNLPLAHRQIVACRAAGVPVMAGGPGFGPDGVWAYALGADRYAADAGGGAEALHHHWPPVLRGESSVAAGAVEAYAMLVRRRPELLRYLVDRTWDAFRDLRGRSGTDREESAELLGRLLDSLAAAVFVDDERVLTGQLAFAGAFLAARSVDPRCLLALTDALAHRLRGSPRALDKLAAGRRRLVEQEDDSRHPG